ncbi:MAG: hypothetical protein J0I20_03390 [Chloroflexi bacterium]|nr:hypothetical protein [Chloroflexota bacterium]OJV89203.1 MAG: hypothetical protein BGO39_34955 [Chloroflexi bacterium 54-19]
MVLIKPTKARPDRLFSSAILLLVILLLLLLMAACGDSSQSLTLNTATSAPTTPAATTPRPADSIASGTTVASSLASTTGPAPATTPVHPVTPTPGPVPTSTGKPNLTNAPPNTIANPLTIVAKDPTTPTVKPPFSLPPSPAAVTPVGPAKEALSQIDPTSYGTLAYEAEGDIWFMILPEGIQRSLTSDGANTRGTFPDGFNRNPVWSPGSISIAFASPADASKESGYQKGYDIYTIRPDGSNRTRVTNGADSLYVRRLPLGWFSTTELIISQTDMRNPPQGGLAPLAILDTKTGQTRDLPITQTGISRVAVSPDGSMLAYAAPVTDPTTKAVKADVFVVPTKGGNPTALTDLPAEANLAVTALTWSPDSKNVAFVRAVGDGCGPYAVYTVGKDGQNLKKLQTATGAPQTLSYSLSGAWLTFSSTNCTDAPTLNVLNVQKGGPPVEMGAGNNPTFGKRIIA